ncbi:retrovirus-related pol polyprotein from transposon TNT 1-94 [Tanacetum coccineum]|uniref:Retrovirus-related pol polyprotein from transposon TNT 1-94 n=1 Tax=Tanacetum coccineum TaxID=301880 RepID=A0ABQ5IXF3_9ASTR
MKRFQRLFWGTFYFLTMLTALWSSPLRITSLPSLSPQTHPSTSQQPPTPPFMQTIHDEEEPATLLHESPLYSVHSLGRDEGSLSLNELTDLCTSLSKKVGALENELQQTKKTYSTAIIKLIFRVKKLEKQVKTSKARRRVRLVLSEDEDVAEDSSKQGRKIFEIDIDPSISLVQDEGPSWFQEDAEIQKKISEKEVSTVGAEIPEVSTANIAVTTAAENLVYIRRSAEKKDKGKGIMIELEPEKKTKKQLEQERLGHEEAVRLQEQLNEEETQRIARDAEIARQLHEEINKAGQERVVAKNDQAHVIDWSDPAVLRYHAQLNKPYSIAEVRKNIVMYLKNQGGYKMNYFKGMKYEDIRPIFEKVWDQIQSFAPMDSEKEKGSEKKGSRKKSLARKRAGEKQSEESSKRQKIEDDIEKENLIAYLDLVSQEKIAMEMNLDTKYPIVDWKTHVLTEYFMYYQIIRAYGSSQNYKIFSEMLDDFDRQDVMDLHRLVEERYATSRPIVSLYGMGDLKILFQHDEEDEVWRHQHEYNLISWRLFNSCGIHILLMDNGIAIHMMIEKKYPLTQEMLSNMLSSKHKVDHENEMSFELLRTDHGREFDNEVQFGEFCNANEPKNVNEALKDDSWIIAMQEELNQFVANNVWELVPQPKNMAIIGTKWVFRNKLDENGVVSGNKARLVAQGYSQQEGIDYDETYAPVARLEYIRILLAYACALDFKLFQMDIKSAFLKCLINEEVYMAQPPGFIDFEKLDHVYKLKKALYGLKQAPKA